MTKSPHKLMLRKETLRALNIIDLTRVVGGAGSATAPIAADNKTHDVNCTLAADAVTSGQ
jgi:hypothetical protein